MQIVKNKKGEVAYYIVDGVHFSNKDDALEYLKSLRDR